MTSTRIEVDDDQFAALEAIRTHHGVNWRGMLIQGAKQLKGLHHPTLAQDPSKRPSLSDCPERPAELDTTNADVDIARRRSSESR